LAFNQYDDFFLLPLFEDTSFFYTLGLSAPICHFGDGLGYARRLKRKEKIMKKLNVVIKLEMSVPDDWELVQTSEGTPVLKLPDGQFMDIAIEPLFASNPEETWSSTDDEATLNDILDMVESEEVAYEFMAD
jgi:hypothetical protein